MVNGILGAGVLGYPFAFRSCGLIAAGGLVLLCLSACTLSMRFLLLSRSVGVIVTELQHDHLLPAHPPQASRLRTRTVSGSAATRHALFSPHLLSQY